MIHFQFTTLSEGWIEDLCRKESATIKILSMKSQDKGSRITHFVDITSNTVRAEELSKFLRDSSEVIESDVAAVGSDRVVGAVTSDSCFVCSLIMNSKTGYFIGPAVTQDDCQMNYKLFMGGDDIPNFLQALHAKGVMYKITEIS